MDIQQAALPVVHLRLRGVLLLHPESPPRVWRMALLDGGLLAELPSPTDDAEDPREWLRSIQGLLGELTDLEQRIGSLRTRQDRAYWKDAPWWMWVALFAQPGLAVLVAMLVGGTVEDRLWSALVVFAVPGLVACGLLFWGYSAARARRRQSRVELDHARRERARVRQHLVDGCAALSARNFVARAGGRLLLGTADLDWLQASSSTARRAREDARAEAIEGKCRELEAELQSVLEDPPQGWSPVGELADRSCWEARPPEDTHG